MIGFSEFQVLFRATDDKSIKKANKELCEKYPFLLPKDDWTGENIEGYDYDWTYLDDMPVGWKKAFGLQMCEELKEILIEGDCLDKYRVLQVKEKIAQLRWYDNGVPQKVYDKYINWLNKYEELSEKTCCKCGEPATQMSKGWICPYCDNCYDKLNKKEE